MNIEIIMDFFYEKASKRIRDRIKLLGLKHYQIYANDYKQISLIINNRRTKNNRFLITDSVLEHFSKDGTTIGLYPMLKFNSKSEILWGTKEEISQYLPSLFELLLNEISKEKNDYQIDKNLFLCDYVPYAKYSTYWNILFTKKNKYPAVAYGIYEDDVIDNYDKAENEALNYLYNKCKDDFFKIFSDFAKETTSFNKINKVFQQSFIKELFIPMLNKFKPDGNSLGLRVKNLIECDLSHCASLICENNSTRNEYFFKLNRASSTYILALEDIQKSNYDFI
jgi:hypothetical protein